MAENLEDVAGKAARRYKRLIKFGWWMDFDDLKQEAMVAALSASRTWDPLVGVPLNAYAWRACMLHLGKHIWRQSSPVSETDHRLKTLARVCRAELHDDVAEDTSDSADAQLTTKQWQTEARTQILVVLRKALGEEAVLATAVLLDEQPPRAVATTNGIKPALVHRATQRGRSAIADNLMLYDMLREL
jgi:DNA-directed RNA polymerase specialized sigma24 family protein